jgi:hypothetical protein
MWMELCIDELLTKVFHNRLKIIRVDMNIVLEYLTNEI